jgi:hypothetical protein
MITLDLSIVQAAALHEILHQAADNDCDLNEYFYSIMNALEEKLGLLPTESPYDFETYNGEDN